MRALFALFGRSLREDVRARLPAILRATLILIILLIIWGNERDFTRRTAPGREFLLMTLLANLGFLAIATLGIFASAITEEKEDQTLPLLRMTNLSPLAILFGKSTTRLIGALLLLAVQIPFTLLAVTLGGVSLDQVLSAYAILGATTFFLCNLALLCSVICRTTIRSGVMTGVTAGLFFAVLPMFCIASALNRMRPGALTPQTAWEHFATWVVEANPVYALVVLLEERAPGRLITGQVTISLGAGLICFVLSWLLFDRFCATAGEVIAGRRRKAGANGRLRGGRPSIPRALAWKDFHFLTGGWRGLLIRIMLAGLVFFSTFAFERWAEERTIDQYFWRTIGQMTMFFATVGFGLEIALAASRTFGEERRGMTLGGLVGLPRTTGWLIRQKLLAAIPIVLPSIAFFGLGFWLVYRTRIVYGYQWGFREQELILIAYVLTQALVLPLLIAVLSLRIRRGALPAGAAIVAAWNIFTGVLMEIVGGRSSEEKILILNSGLCLAAAVWLATRIYRGIPRAAAAE